MERNHILMTYYAKYLKEIRGLSDSSINHYRDALNYISRFLTAHGKIQESIYEIQSIDQLEILRSYLTSQPEFVALNKRGNQMYSAGLNNYIRFANGEEFNNVHEKISALDFAVAIPEKQTVIIESWSRSNIIKTQAIEYAAYKCEFDHAHTTFTSKGTGRQYMEGHHAIPMHFQDKFDHSLDVYANVVCLCPVCHRLLHYGTETEKMNVLNKIYYERADRLALCGIEISKNDFEKLVI